MTVPYTFSTATTAIPLSQLDSNFATGIILGNTTIQLGDTVSVLNNMTFANVTLTSATINGTSLVNATISNTRINPRVSTSASASSVTPDISLYDIYEYTALAASLTINAPTGTPLNGNKLIFRILDNGTSRTLTWNGTYTPIGLVLPSSTTPAKTLYVGCMYNANATRWDVVGVVLQT